MQNMKTLLNILCIVYIQKMISFCPSYFVIVSDTLAMYVVSVKSS